MSVSRESAAELATGLIKVMRLMHSRKTQAPRIHPGVDVASYPLLLNLTAEPRRVSGLADCVHSDVSTVSRQVSALASLGLVTKVSDPDDGRAQLLTLTDEGQRLLDRLAEQRTNWFHALLQDWSEPDVATFCGYLGRFLTALEASRAGANPLTASTSTTEKP